MYSGKDKAFPLPIILNLFTSYISTLFLKLLSWPIIVYSLNDKVFVYQKALISVFKLKITFMKLQLTCKDSKGYFEVKKGLRILK